MKKKGMKRTLAVLMTALMLGTAGCGSSGSAGKEKSEATTEAFSRSLGMDRSYAAAGDEYEPEYYNDEAYEYEAATEASYKQNSVSGSQTSNSGEQGGTTSTLPEIAEDKLVYHCSMTFESTHYEESVAIVRSMIKTYSGFLESEDVYTTGGYGSEESRYVYSATIRVPADQYQDFVNATGSIGELKNQTQNVDNLTQEYSDLSAELEVLETKRKSYLAMMEEAKSLNDMTNLLMVDDKLTAVEISINQIKTRMNRINNDAAYSYISVTISEVAKYQEPKAETFGDRVSRAFRNAKNGFVNKCKSLVVWCARHIIPLGVCIVIVFIFWIAVIRPWRKKNKDARKARKEARKEARKNGTPVRKDAPQNNPATANVGQMTGAPQMNPAQMNMAPQTNMMPMMQNGYPQMPAQAGMAQQMPETNEPSQEASDETSAPEEPQK